MTNPTPLSSQQGSNTWLVSPHTRLVGVLCVMLLLCIPFFALKRFIEYRAEQHTQTEKTITKQWGQAQTLIGPILVLPYVEHLTSIGTVTDTNGESRVASKDVYNNHTAILLPQTLDIRADLKAEQPHLPHNNLSALVYQANLSLSGVFDHEALLKTGKGERKIQWDKAYIALGMSDTKALQEEVNVTWDGTRLSFASGTQLPSLLPTGVHIPFLGNTNNGNKHEFKFTFNIHGSENLSFAPLGENTKIRLASTWAQPQFFGDIPPSKQSITEQGFNVEWKLPPLIRDYKQTWEMDDQQTTNLQQVAIGVGLMPPPTLYQNSLKLLPYGFLMAVFILLWVLAFDKQKTNQRLNIIHYAVTGGFFGIFYLILLALGEQLAFLHAYVVSATAVIVCLTLYMAWLLRSSWQTLWLLSLLIALYAGMYLLLLHPRWLLVSAVGMVVSMGVLLMYISLTRPRATSSS